MPPQTVYQVLVSYGAAFEPLQLVEAWSADHAVRIAAADTLTGDTAAGFFVAVPARSWSPIKVTRKVETTLVLEEVQS